MAGITRTIHPVANFTWASLKTIAPDVDVQQAPQLGNGSEPEEPMALAFIDPDGEAHVYVFTPQGRENLIRTLTGGLIVP